MQKPHATRARLAIVRRNMNNYIACNGNSKNKGSIAMSRNYARRINNFFDLIGSAYSVSAAARENRKARPEDLRRLGIDPDQFNGMFRR